MKNECYSLYPNVRLTTKHVDFLYMYKCGSNCNILHEGSTERKICRRVQA